MFRFLKAIWKDDRRGFLEILALNIVVSLMGGVSIVLMLPMLQLMESSSFASEFFIYHSSKLELRRVSIYTFTALA